MLFASLDKLKAPYTNCLEKQEYEKAFHILAELQAPLADLFDHVQILSDDPKLRGNRLALLEPRWEPH